ncbi:pancreatic lipase-related protein 2-like [Trachemys scripta elegans]|uniref:pancreatic lipase-related protein 2-like n=1 Tax=Trachemys scripta elegans TaxID=31138 RepID=UPI00155516FD|nr:pancreatic lipase-related protein 2-like [Trachemys scripta elegans]XP_034633397.1 pancreatic lipase-related protein 2-like [Trachemys scripta elegans]XP_034633398.1 pancreatic lipase-related protein 2-like [Trachemys scripta elegans]XP_034633399.1 pancreatic lipase-related protein 2-like [Trachemys scripta elegans]
MFTQMIGIWLAALYLLDPTAGEKVCYRRLGCFSDKPPWAGIPGRFLAGLPDPPESMNISFTLYTKETRNNSQQKPKTERAWRMNGHLIPAERGEAVEQRDLCNTFLNYQRLIFLLT